MSRSRKVSLGFQVVDVRTGEALSPVFDKRAPARVEAARLYEAGKNCGVRHLEDYAAADANKDEVARMRAAVRLPPGTVSA